LNPIPTSVFSFQNINLLIPFFIRLKFGLPFAFSFVKQKFKGFLQKPITKNSLIANPQANFPIIFHKININHFVFLRPISCPLSVDVIYKLINISSPSEINNEKKNSIKLLTFKGLFPLGGAKSTFFLYPREEKKAFNISASTRYENVCFMFYAPSIPPFMFKQLKIHQHIN
jgi:hypothetical protein